MNEFNGKVADGCYNYQSLTETNSVELKSSSHQDVNASNCEVGVDIEGEKKSNKNWKTICTSGCRYDVVHEVARNMGLREVGLNEEWIVHWTDSAVSFDKISEMKIFQKINHFPGMMEICRKDLLAKNLNKMFKMFPVEYSIFPLTWCLPQEYPDLIHYVGNKKRTLICKPDSGCQGKGISIVRSTKEVSPNDRQVVQQYITKPFLIDGYKFDFRIYVLITAVEPDFRLYVYKEGLARFATVKFERPNSGNVNNMFMHLTNYAVNRRSCHFVQDDVAGSKRKLSSVTKWWQEHEYDTGAIWQRIDDAIVKTFLSAIGILRHSYRSCFPNHVGVNPCFEILGFDILVDHRLNPFVLEVNLSPSFNTDSNVDKEVKEGLIRNTLELIEWDNCNPKRCREEERRRVRNRLFHSVEKTDDGICGKRKNARIDLEDVINSREIFELDHMKDFRLIYPVLGSKEKYEQFYPTGFSVHQNTIASRAREECAKMLRDELRTTISRKLRAPYTPPILLYKAKSILNPARIDGHKNEGTTLPVSCSSGLATWLKLKRKRHLARTVVKPTVVDICTNLPYP